MTALVAGSLLTAGLLHSQPAQALSFTTNSVTFDSGDVNSSVDVFFNGGLVGDSQLSPNPSPSDDLNATVTVTLNSFMNGVASLSFDLMNQASGGLTSATIKTLALNSNPNVGENSFSIIPGLSGTPGADFDKTDRGNIPNNVGNREICFTTNTCAGGGNGGAAIGETASFGGVLNFADPTVSLFTLSDFAIRWQQINGTVNSTVVTGASGTSVGRVPTPAMLPGLIAMSMAALRKRRDEQLAEVDS